MEEEGEEGERDRLVDSGSPPGELGGAGHLPLEVERGTPEGEHQRQWEWWSIQGEGLANHHPVEEEGVGSLTKTRRVDWLKAFTKITSKYYHFNLTQNRTAKQSKLSGIFGHFEICWLAVALMPGRYPGIYFYALKGALWRVFFFDKTRSMFRLAKDSWFNHRRRQSLWVCVRKGIRHK